MIGMCWFSFLQGSSFSFRCCSGIELQGSVFVNSRQRCCWHDARTDVVSRSRWMGCVPTPTPPLTERLDKNRERKGISFRPQAEFVWNLPRLRRCLALPMTVECTMSFPDVGQEGLNGNVTAFAAHNLNLCGMCRSFICCLTHSKHLTRRSL